MKGGPLVRSLLASAALAAQLLLAGCDTDGIAPTTRSLQPLSPALLSDISQKNMAVESPMLVRIFKEESELEVWKQDRTGNFALLKTFPICRWSGELGPKIREGDRVAPEGFYAITPSLMNPNSSYYLAINLGFPNAYDRANGRDGAFLMIHGDCSSRGCYAMTDEQVGEIYALARESFFGGQRSFQIQAYPFKMTALNMARHRNSPHMGFWRMLKQGYDHFELTRQEPKVDVCEKRYVFDAETTGKFTPAGKCPPYQLNANLAAALSDKQQREDRQMAEFVSRGTPTVPVRTGTDGGMHPVFLAAIKARRNVNPDAPIRDSGLPGTIPPDVRPPGEPQPEAVTASVPSRATSTPAYAAPTPSVVASAQPAGQSGSSGNFFGGLFASNGESQQNSPGMLGRMSRMVGLNKEEPQPAAPPPPTPKAKPPARPNQTAAAKAPPKSPADAQQQARPVANNVATRPAAKSPEATDDQQAKSNAAGLLNGAQPTVPSGGFDTRFGAWR